MYLFTKQCTSIQEYFQLIFLNYILHETLFFLKFLAGVILKPFKKSCYMGTEKSGIIDTFIQIKISTYAIQPVRSAEEQRCYRKDYCSTATAPTKRSTKVRITKPGPEYMSDVAKRKMMSRVVKKVTTTLLRKNFLALTELMDRVDSPDLSKVNYISYT